ncbi:hypothetical protein NUW54_g5827 [Trametes sanguinea]|uniref:Uncharacterized protein n=1 Tax=Trametes sanguinea TaxID=158606 RepID=A0ACC1PU23_9APHY|nr:hypothetical protein NUW54_g5827 [Trametes sanguinea]
MADDLKSLNKYSIMERMSALKTYQAAWRLSSPRRLKTLYSECSTPDLILPFSGGVLPLVVGPNLKLISPACSVRSKPYGDWMLDLASYNIRPHFCATDTSQDLLVLCTIRGDLLGWLWFDGPPELRVYNWRTGQVVWRYPTSTGSFDFAFLDDATILVVQVHRLLVYTIDVNASITVDTTDWHELGPIPTATCQLGLPPVIDGAIINIKTFSSRRPSSSNERKCLFDMDPSCATIAFTINVTTSICAPFEQYLIVVPISAIIAALDSTISDKAVEITEDSIPFTLQWQSWGARSLILPFLHRELPKWYRTGLSAVGNKCALAFRCVETYPNLVDVLVFDVQVAGDLEDPNPVDPKDFLPPSDHEDCTPELLSFPIRNRLPYHLVRKVFTYDEHVDSSWLSHSIHLLDDGIALMVWDFDGTASEVYLISVDAGESGRSTTPMFSEVNGAR